MWRRRGDAGSSIIEVTVVAGIVGTLSALGAMTYLRAIEVPEAVASAADLRSATLTELMGDTPIDVPGLDRQERDGSVGFALADDMGRCWLSLLTSDGKMVTGGGEQTDTCTAALAFSLDT